MKFQRGEFLFFVQRGHAALRVRRDPLTGVVLMWARYRRAVLPFHLMLTWDYDDMTFGWTWMRGRRPMPLTPTMGEMEWLTNMRSRWAGIFRRPAPTTSL